MAKFYSFAPEAYNWNTVDFWRTRSHLERIEKAAMELRQMHVMYVPGRWKSDEPKPAPKLVQKTFDFMEEA